MKVRAVDILHNLKEWDSEILGRYKMEDYERESLIEILEEVVKNDVAVSQREL